MKKQILVTGGTGYIGSHTSVELINAGYDVIIVDNLDNSRIEVLDGIEKITGVKPAFENIDLKEKEKVNSLFKKYPDIEAIIHFAAHKAVGESVREPLKYYNNNINSLLNLLENMKGSKAKNIVFSSSCTVYGQPDVLPVTEKAPIKKAESPYGNTKQMCEEILENTVKTFTDINSIALRYFNPIGAHPSSEIGEFPQGVPDNLVPFITQTAYGLRDELKVFGDDYDTPDGSCIRDYINVVDLAKAHVIAISRLLEKKHKSNFEIFNLGTGKGVSVLEIINSFEKSTGVKLKYKIVDRRAGDIVKVWSDTKFANEELGWDAKESLDNTLKSAWDWEQKIRKELESK